METQSATQITKKKEKVMDCNKIPYATEREARRVIRRMWKSPHTGKLPIRAYFCQKHKAWHITSKPEGKPNGRR